MVPAFDYFSRDVFFVPGFMPVLDARFHCRSWLFQIRWNHRLYCPQTTLFSFEATLVELQNIAMSWNRGWSTSSWGSSSWDKNNSSGWNNRDWQQTTNHPPAISPPSQPSVPGGTVSIPSSFTPDWECYDSNSVSNKRFYRNIQSTPWSTKSGLAGKDIADLRVTELTRKRLGDFSLRCLSNGEFQSLVFVRSISEAVFVSNMLRHIRQDRIDLDAVAAHMHGPAPPDKHKESARFMNLCSKLFQQSNLTPLYRRRRAPRVLKVRSWQKPRGSCRELELL